MSEQRERCSNASRYKALRPPSCGCVACESKWLIAEQERRIALGYPVVDPEWGIT